MNKFGPKAQEKVEKAMHEMKEGGKFRKSSHETSNVARQFSFR